MSPYILYGGGLTLGAGPQIVLNELNIPYRVKVVDILDNQQKLPDYLQINPAGYLPAMVCPDGAVLHEAAAIMLYLADKYSHETLSPGLHDNKRGIFLSRLWFLSNDLQPPIKAFFYPGRYSTDRSDAARIMEQARLTAMDRWKIINDKFLADKLYLLDGRLTIADILLAVLASYGLTDVNEVLDTYPGVRRLYKAVSARPACIDLLTRINREMAEFHLKRQQLSD